MKYKYLAALSLLILMVLLYSIGSVESQQGSSYSYDEIMFVDNQLMQGNLPDDVFSIVKNLNQREFLTYISIVFEANLVTHSHYLDLEGAEIDVFFVRRPARQSASYTPTPEGALS